MEKLWIVLLVSVGCLLAWGNETPQLTNFLWTCQIPCETNDVPPRILRSIEFAWCGKSVLSDDMLQSMNDSCKNANKGSDVRAVYHSYSEMVADCITSGNTCPKEGFVKVGYSCVVECPNESHPRRYAVCAYNNLDAWSAAFQVCDHPKRPSAIPEARVCNPNGQTPCGQ